MKYIVLDLEATCWESRDHQPNEIIEIGAVCIDEQKKTIGELDILVKPSIHPQLSPFCTKLTTITQDMLADAPLFPEAFAQFQAWLASFEDDYWLCSWGFYDKAQFRRDCLLHQLDTTWLENHISLKHQYQDIARSSRGMGMEAALKREKIPLVGTHHRGIDDAKNIAKIFVKHFDKWAFVRNTH